MTFVFGWATRDRILKAGSRASAVGREEMAATAHRGRGSHASVAGKRLSVAEPRAAKEVSIWSEVVRFEVFWIAAPSASRCVKPVPSDMPCTSGTKMSFLQ